MVPKPVRSREELIDYIFSLLDEHDAIGDRWENQNLYSFLQALAAWLNDCEGYYRDTGQSVDARQPSWQLFADALSAASVYE